VFPHLWLAEALQKQGKLDEAEFHFREGIARFKQFAFDFPKRKETTQFLGYGQWRLADLLAKTDRLDEAQQVRTRLARFLSRQPTNFVRKPNPVTSAP